MLTTQLREQVARFTYKPNVTLRVDYADWAAAWILTARGMFPDANDPDKQTMVARTKAFDVIGAKRCINDPTYLRYEIQWLLTKLEIHELDEWLKFDGDFVRAPHGKAA